MAVYGDVAQCIDSGVWRPQAAIVSAKVLRGDPQSPDRVIFPDNHRPEALVEQAIRHFHNTRNCRVFNLSVGNVHDVYSGGRQFAWAEILDQLARELDVVIVVAAGNDPDPEMPASAATREAFQAGVRDAALNNPLGRLCNPATASIAVTVGSVARSARPRTPHSFAGVPEGAPAPFSRLGPGHENGETQRGIKPDFVAQGGNFAVTRIAGGHPRWATDINLGEPTTRLNTDGGRILTAVSGTSFATPHVSHAAAFALDAAAGAVGSATANAARALLGVSAETPSCGPTWLLDSESKETWDKLRLCGFGVVDIGRVRGSIRNDVCLLASDQVQEDHWHVYEVRIPPAFLEGHGDRGILVSLAFDPPVRSSRKEYLGRTMWLEIMKGLTVQEVRNFRTRHTGPGKAPALPTSKLLDMRPPKTHLQWSTLQVRRKTWTRRPTFHTNLKNADPQIHVLVGCQRRFPHGEATSQRYSVALRFWHSDGHVDLYQQIRARVRTRAVVRAPA